ncbi:MAG TPA: MFS transporter [Rhizomicrobium sp.]|nr:MFS transporter [Rhizomicrobium sp.]
MPQIHPDGLPLPLRYWAIATMGLGVSMAVMDGAIANVALPTIARDLHTDAAFSIWIVNGYQLAIMISLLPLAALGEIVGHRRIYLAGMALFTLASLACSFSQTFLELAAARVVQGFGAAGIMAVNTAVLRFVYPHRLLGRGIGINALVVAVSAAAGPTIAAAILSLGRWPWLFAVNVPIGIAGLVIGRISLPLNPLSKREFDYPSALLSASMFGLLIAGIDAVGHGESIAWFALEAAGVAALAWALVRRASSVAAPLLPLDLLRIPIFTLSVATSVCSFIAQMLALVSLPFLFQDKLGYSPVATGLLITPWALAIAAAAPVSGRLADRYPPGLLCTVGLVVFACGLLALAFLPAHPDVIGIVWRMALMGTGFGIFQSPNNRAMLSAAPRERSGGASGMLGSARLLGQTTGAALVALLFARIPQAGNEAALLVGAGFAVLAACVSSARLLESPQREGSHETRDV